jgi:basic membrane lipoprotein Med (substrate-binding protein (PBP1-ABC) superfamily)
MQWESMLANVTWETNIIASETKRVDVAVYETIKSAFDGTFQGGIVEKGVAEGWIGNCRLSEEQPFWEKTFNLSIK